MNQQTLFVFRDVGRTEVVFSVRMRKKNHYHYFTECNTHKALADGDTSERKKRQIYQFNGL